MNFSSTAKRVGIIGGGIFGVSTALQLAKLGVEVTLINDGPLSNGASGRSLAWLNSANFRSREYHELRVMGIDRWRTFLAQRPNTAEFLKFDGGLTWEIDGAGDKLRSVLDYEHSIGYDGQWLSADEVATVAPGVDLSAVSAEGAVFNPGEGWVDLPRVIALLVEDFIALGGTVIENAGESRIVVADDKVTGVATADGHVIDVDAALLATGPSVPYAMRDLGVPMGDESPVALLLFTKPVDTKLKAVLNTPRIAVRPTPEGGLALDSGWSEEEITVHEDGTFEYLESTVQGLLAEASKVLEGNPTLEVESIGAGRKPIPGGGEPVFGELTQISGYFVAFSHSGATQGLFVPELLAREIAFGIESPLLKNFRPGRYSA
ncbi:FAD-binding oxidoreductase [Salinibacterium amurskyense]|uniref:NAD(P)/FAD-dependent oxidoreductase n=1 Tax=Salinibacterium amurskyense TaxID=205941 RepID=UPI00311FC264